MAMDKEAKSQCIGGWSFLTLSFGLFVFIPGTIVLGIYAADDGWTTEKIIGVALFTTASITLIIGIALCIYWCLTTKIGGEVKDPEAGKNDAQANGSSAPKAESNGAALSESAAKYESHPMNGEDAREESGSLQSGQDEGLARRLASSEPL